MSRRSKGPRLYLRPRDGRPAIWVIRDGGNERSTGCSQDQLAEAERALERHIGEKHQGPEKAGGRGLDKIAIADVLNAYLTEHAPHVARPDFIKHTAAPILDYWGAKTLAHVKGAECRAYVAWRTRQLVSASTRPRKDGSLPPQRFVTESTARHDLKTLRAAIEYYHREYGPLPAVPTVTMPEAAEPRPDWLARSQAAKLLRAARASRRSSHLARLILIGLYTGTRSGAIKGLRWLPSTASGWIDLERGVLHRRGTAERSGKKARPPVKLPDRLLAHLRRWKRMDDGLGARYGVKKRKPRPSTWVVHFYGRPIARVDKAFATACVTAGLPESITPHILRHTAATWLMQVGVPIYEAAGFLGMSAATLERVYGHHHPDYQSRAANAVANRRPQ